MTEPRFFRSVASFRRWLARNHARHSEVFVGLYKKHAARRGMTYPEAVDEALCWGWIDGVMRRLDDDRVMQRFTPRRSKSTWSLVNIGKVKGLLKAGRMQAPGLAAFKKRDPARSGQYSFEKASVAFTRAQVAEFRRAAKAWKWFGAQAPSYQRVATNWVISAKQETTRVRRLSQLIEHCKAGKKLRQFTPMHQRSK